VPNNEPVNDPVNEPELGVRSNDVVSPLVKRIVFPGLIIDAVTKALPNKLGPVVVDEV
jgi:hypothetical protein